MTTQERSGKSGRMLSRATLPQAPPGGHCNTTATSAPAPVIGFGLYLLSPALFWKDSIPLEENIFKGLDQTAQDNISNFPLAPQDNGKQQKAWGLGGAKVIINVVEAHLLGQGHS